MTTHNQRVVLVGRHDSGDIPGVAVADRENIIWPLEGIECIEALKALADRAKNLDAVILFQTIPGTLAVALAAYPIRYGVMIAVPDVAARLAPIAATVNFENEDDATKVANIIRIVNGRAKVKVRDTGLGVYVVEVEVESVTPFRLDHIEWVYPPQEIKDLVDALGVMADFAHEMADHGGGPLFGEALAVAAWMKAKYGRGVMWHHRGREGEILFDGYQQAEAEAFQRWNQ